MNAVALICARGGSKGLPGKNILPLAGKPLIGWAIAQAAAVARVQRVIVSTDDATIADVARASGAEVPFMRPAQLAQDTSPEWLVWRHALEFLHRDAGDYPDALLVVPTTAPLRHPADLDRCLDVFSRGDSDVVITVTEAHRSPYFNMVRQHTDGSVGLVIPPEAAVRRRQDAPAVYDMTTVGYVARPAFVMDRMGLFEGRVRQVEVPLERAVDIDTALDFAYAEFLITRERAEAGSPATAGPPEHGA